jgi:hypothetical protein
VSSDSCCLALAMPFLSFTVIFIVVLTNFDLLLGEIN